MLSSVPEVYCNIEIGVYALRSEAKAAQILLNIPWMSDE
jgi:hypothetical protein